MNVLFWFQRHFALHFAVFLAGFTGKANDSVIITSYSERCAGARGCPSLVAESIGALVCPGQVLNPACQEARDITGHQVDCLHVMSRKPLNSRIMKLVIIWMTLSSHLGPEEQVLGRINPEAFSFHCGVRHVNVHEIQISGATYLGNTITAPPTSQVLCKPSACINSFHPHVGP